MKKELLAIEEHTDRVFGKSCNGTVTFLNSGEEIPVEHLYYREIPPDGYYELSPCTCSGSCSVGVPKPKCIKNGIYDPNKCSVYNTYDIGTQRITIDTFLKLVDAKLNSVEICEPQSEK